MKATEFVSSVRNSGIAVLTVIEASRIIGKNQKYASLYLTRLVNAGYVERVEKGKYCLKGANAYAVASNIVHPSYVSMLSAFRYYGLTTQTISTIDVISAKRHKRVSISGYTISFSVVPRKFMFGFCRSKEDGAFVAYFEKALIDALLIGKLPLPYIEEAIGNAKELNIFNRARLIAYANRVGLKAQGARLSTILSIIGIAPGMKNRVLYNGSI